MAIPELRDAQACIERGTPAEAISLLKRIVSRRPTYAAAHALLAQACEAVEAWEEAHAAWRQAAFLVPASSVARDGLQRTRRRRMVPTPPPEPEPATADEPDRPQDEPAPPPLAPAAPEPEEAQQGPASPEAFPKWQPVSTEQDATLGPRFPNADIDRSVRDLAAFLTLSEPPQEAVVDVRPVREGRPTIAGLGAEAPAPAPDLPAVEEGPAAAPKDAPEDAGPGADEHVEQEPAPEPVGATPETEVLPEKHVEAGGADPAARQETEAPADDLRDKTVTEAEEEMPPPNERPATLPDAQAAAPPPEDAQQAPWNEADFDDLDQLIEELEAARIVPGPDPGQIPMPDLEVDIEDVVSETLARIYASQRQYEEAARVYERLAHQHPDHADDFLSKASDMRDRSNALNK